jgi:hypothetical protein
MNYYCNMYSLVEHLYGEYWITTYFEDVIAKFQIYLASIHDVTHQWD